MSGILAYLEKRERIGEYFKEREKRRKEGRTTEERKDEEPGKREVRRD